MNVVNNNIDNCINNIVNNINILNSVSDYNVLKRNFTKLLQIDKLIAAEIINDIDNDEF